MGIAGLGAPAPKQPPVRLKAGRSQLEAPSSDHVLHAGEVPAVPQCESKIAVEQKVVVQSAVQIFASPFEVELPGPQQAQPFLWHVPHPPVVKQQSVGLLGSQERLRQNDWLAASAGVGAMIE